MAGFGLSGLSFGLSGSSFGLSGLSGFGFGLGLSRLRVRSSGFVRLRLVGFGGLSGLVGLCSASAGSGLDRLRLVGAGLVRLRLPASCRRVVGLRRRLVDRHRTSLRRRAPVIRPRALVDPRRRPVRRGDHGHAHRLLRPGPGRLQVRSAKVGTEAARAAATSPGVGCAAVTGAPPRRSRRRRMAAATTGRSRRDLRLLRDRPSGSADGVAALAADSQHDGVEAGLTSGLCWLGARLVDAGARRDVLGLADEGWPAGQQLVQHAADRVEIQLRLSARTLRRPGDRKRW